jgi:hypothetical protein
MGYGETIRRTAGWACAGMVAVLIMMGYHFGNVRFVPVAAGFAILAGLFLLVRPTEQMRSNVIQSGADPRID